MTQKRKTIALRFIRSLAAVVVTSLAAWLAGPDAAELVGAQVQGLIIAFGVPMLVALDKWLRYGQDEDDLVKEDWDNIEVSDEEFFAE